MSWPNQAPVGSQAGWLLLVLLILGHLLKVSVTGLKSARADGSSSQKPEKRLVRQGTGQLFGAGLF